MNYSLLTNFPEHLSITFDTFQFIVGAILAITSTIRLYQTKGKSIHCIILWFMGLLVAGESFKTGALLSSDMLLMLAGAIGYQGYMICRNFYKRLLVCLGKEYVKPAWMEGLFPQVFPCIAIVSVMAVFIVIHDKLF